jgi:hypothetical protein
VRIECHVQQAALALGDDLGHALERFGYLAVLGDDAKPAGSLGHEHAPVGQEGKAPRVLKSIGEGLHLERALRGIDLSLLGERVARQEHQRRHREQVARHNSRMTVADMSQLRLLYCHVTPPTPARLV